MRTFSLKHVIVFINCDSMSCVQCPFHRGISDYLTTWHLVPNWKGKEVEGYEAQLSNAVRWTDAWHLFVRIIAVLHKFCRKLPIADISLGEWLRLPRHEKDSQLVWAKIHSKTLFRTRSRIIRGHQRPLQIWCLDATGLTSWYYEIWLMHSSCYRKLALHSTKFQTTRWRLP